MEMSKRKFLVAVSLIAVLTFLGGYSIAQVSLKNHRNPSARDNVYIFKETPKGTEMIYGGNIITDRFENKLANIFGFDNETVYETKWIALGNSSISKTKTKLDTEATGSGFHRQVSSSIVKWTNGEDIAVNYTLKFTANETVQINAAALHESITAEATDCVALASLGGAQDFEDNWNCTIVWALTWDAND